MDDERLRQRLIGATIILALAVAFLPMVLRGPETEVPDSRAAQDDGPARIIQLSEAEERERQRWMVVPERKPAAEAPARPDPKPEPDVGELAKPADAPPEAPKQAAEAPAPREATRPARTPSARPAEAATEAVPTQAGFVVQMGSFSVRRNADGLRDRLRTNGYDAFVETLETPRGPVYRVRVGPSETRAQADTLREALHTEMGMQGLVLRHP